MNVSTYIVRDIIVYMHIQCPRMYIYIYGLCICYIYTFFFSRIKRCGCIASVCVCRGFGVSVQFYTIHIAYRVKDLGFRDQGFFIYIHGLGFCFSIVLLIFFYTLFYLTRERLSNTAIGRHCSECANHFSTVQLYGNVRCDRPIFDLAGFHFLQTNTSIFNRRFKYIARDCRRTSVWDSSCYPEVQKC